MTDPKNIHNNPRLDNNPAIDQALTKALQDTDPTQAVADANAADKLATDQASLIPLYQRPQIWATKNTLANFGAFGFQDYDWTKVGFTS